MKKYNLLLVFCYLLSLFSYSQNVGIGVTEPTNKLQVGGNFLVNTAYTVTNTPPTVAQTKTMVNATTISFLTDSTGRVYDPGGPAGNYPNNITAYAEVYGFQNNGFEITLEDVDLGTGDSLIIKQSSNTTVPPWLAIGNGYNTPGKILLSSNSFGGYFYIVFKSNNDGNTGRGFSLLFKSLNNNLSLPDLTGFAGNTMFFDTKTASLRSGIINNEIRGYGSVGFGAHPLASGSFSVSMGGKATGHASLAMGNNTQSTGNASTSLGYQTIASGNYSLVTGQLSQASGDAALALGGFNARATGNGAVSIGHSTIANADYATAIGYESQASALGAVAIGREALASGASSFASGHRTHATGTASTAMGYISYANGENSTAIGTNVNAIGVGSTALGRFVTASGDASMALGSYVTTSNFNGAFALGDNSTTTIMASFVANGFRSRFAGGYRLLTNSAATLGVVLIPDATSWSAISDVRMKENFLSVDGERILSRIALLPLTTWNYKAQATKTSRHYGPMAQDFFTAFGKDDFGTIGCDTLINQQDFLGVNLIAIQALEKRTQRIEILEQQISALQKVNAVLQEEMKNLLYNLKKNNQLLLLTDH